VELASTYSSVTGWRLDSFGLEGIIFILFSLRRLAFAQPWSWVPDKVPRRLSSRYYTAGMTTRVISPAFATRVNMLD
jgi:hypothetical protein